MCLPTMVEAIILDKKITNTTGIEKLFNGYVEPEERTEGFHRAQTTGKEGYRSQNLRL